MTKVMAASRSTRNKKLGFGYFVFFFFLITYTHGSEDEDLPLHQSEQVAQQIADTVKIETSKSVRDTKTLEDSLYQSIVPKKSEEAILTTFSGTQGSYTERSEKRKRHLDDNSIHDNNNVDSTNKIGVLTKGRGNADQRDEYNFIKPTKTQGRDAPNILKTSMSGEEQGVLITESGPLVSSDERKSSESGERNSRGFNVPELDKLYDLAHVGTNVNKIESLGAIAKVSVDEPGLVQQNFRKSRDEENRKANPDIQDIITGIVKILHGKANGQSHHEVMRPSRPQTTRINNRGPPRISDVPPLDFENPPSYTPLLPPPPSHGNRIPPPYPFDVPPSPPPNIPLPPQPPKPNVSRLPTHPFIDGVPIPELLIPNQQNPTDYDTISMSDPGGPKGPPLLTNNSSNTTYAPTKTNSTLVKPEYNKHKGTSHKGSQNSQPAGNKNNNKRVRPRPPVRTRPANTTKPLKPPEGTKKQPPLTMKPVTEIITDTTTDTTTTPTTKETTGRPIEEAGDVITGTKKENGPENPKDSSYSKSSTSKLLLEQAVTPTSKVIQPTAVVTAVVTETELPLLLDPIIGIGEATPVLQPSSPASASSGPTQQLQKPTPVLSSASTKFEARPGIVLDDPEYKPGGHKRPHRPIITAPPAGAYGEIFDVTVHAIQGEANPGKSVTVPAHGHGSDVSVITKPQEGQDFVSIDGKRTYINLFGETATSQIAPTALQTPPILGTSFPLPAPGRPNQAPARPASPATPPPRRPYKRPTHPPVRIDTCIVGDDSTCDAAQNEMCLTEEEVSSCHCRPGYNRKKHRDPCRRVVSMMTSLRVDRLYDRKLVWRDSFQDPESDEYQELSYEASQAIESAMSMTPFSDDFIASRINSIYAGKNIETNDPAVYINVTLQLQENVDTIRPAVRQDIQRHLLRVIHRRNNNVGSSAVWVDNPPGSVLALEDVDECSSKDLHDCHARADCSNTFGSFKCQCQNGLRDPWVGNIHREGRHCESCGTEFCNNRGECKFEHGQQVCHCTGSFYGAQCEVDGEVLGVAIGASVAAAIIIILTLICLCMWSRRWSREQKSAVGAGLGSPVFGFMAGGPTVKTPSVGAPPYQVSLEDRIRWAQIADVMAHANYYAQPEPGNGGARTTFGGYPTLPSSHPMGSLPLPAIAPPVPLPRLTITGKGPHSTYGAHSQHGSMHQSTHGLRSSLDTSSTYGDEDRVDLLGRSVNASRPKSRASLTNQSGIYYDVDMDRAEIYGKQDIPMNTYTMSSQHQTRPFYR